MCFRSNIDGLLNLLFQLKQLAQGSKAARVYVNQKRFKLLLAKKNRLVLRGRGVE